MGSSASKPVADKPSSTETFSEKARYTVGVDSSRAVAQGSSIINHHAADRLARIQAETLQRFGTASTSSASGASALADRAAGISLKTIPSWQDAALATQAARLAQMTLHNAAIKDSLHKRSVEVACEHVFSHAVPYEVKPVVNQRNSGRCWLFATCNVIRHQAAKVLELDEFELSQSYLSFWDKLEKSNYFLENMIELADEALDQRVVGFLKTAPTNDGGQWDMVANLLEKYGVVPKSVFPESYNSSYSSQINWLVTLKLREYTLELRQIKKDVERKLRSSSSSSSAVDVARAVQQAQRARKDEQMQEVYRLLVISLGTPPQPDDEFTYNYRNKAGKFVTVRSTPRKFLAEYTGSFDHKQRCSLIHDPRHPADRLITVERLGNVWEGTPISYVNTTVDVMRQAVVSSIKAGHPVFFGCDVGQFSDTKTGIMNPDLFGYEEAFNITLGLTKAQRIELGESSMTHAMVITAVHVDDRTGKVERYRVENSWGEAGVGNDKGFMVMSDKWFEEFNYQVVVSKQFMPKHLWSLFTRGVDDKSIRLPPYDPLGALA
ncbi:related to LAP3-member of the GAL regulon [Sporisorium reilianum f. sp. reilianum]|uniref:Cysteine proteinase 1, mitochondrial n=1 Tax=Sporisorium reilianum f. sp. reilianum TaxID=72559 RepID=A0A2N8UAH1_9BASI|nr:related to LAP3-member of the GAL regulon [Sporisorium reilianum f. sp. reilianum]